MQRIARARAATNPAGWSTPAAALAVLLGAFAGLAAPSADALTARQPFSAAATPRPPLRARHDTSTRYRGHAAVIGGRPALAGAFSSVAAIVDIHGTKAIQCTGTVVDPIMVLTAGHCAENLRTGVANAASGYRVMTGGVDRAGGGWQVSTVSAVLVYGGFSRRSADGDAALLVLSTPTTAPAIALATAVNTRDPRAGSTAMLAGWGKTRYEQVTPTDRLQWAETVVQGKRWCTRNAPPFDVSGELCTVAAPRYATGACDGDSGGPLVVSRPDGGLVQIGIASHVYGRCSTRLPSVFTRVAPVSAWVHSWINAYNLKPPPTGP